MFYVSCNFEIWLQIMITFSIYNTCITCPSEFFRSIVIYLKKEKKNQAHAERLLLGISRFSALIKLLLYISSNSRFCETPNNITEYEVRWKQ